MNHLSRRAFIGRSAATAVGLTILPGHVVSGFGHIPPSDKLNIAGIGIGGKGAVNLRNMKGQNIVALCDVDWDYAAPVFKEYPKAGKWKDYRRMIEEQKDIDACMIATPDHTHTIPAMLAMQAGKHVYVQKPLTHSVWESRQLTLAAKKYNLATQMGIEGHSNDNVRKVAEYIWNGTIGEIRKVHTWTNRPIWPQGLDRPAEKAEIPETLEWDLFLGPAPWRPYHPAYTPWNWRGWWDFGTGALGDMGCHVLDLVFYSLKLGYPVAVEASSSPVNNESPPIASQIEYTFPARKDLPKLAMPEVKVTWSDGGLLPPRPEELPDGESLGSPGGGNLFIGTKGKIICSNYGGDYKLLPQDREFPEPEETVDRIPDHPLGGGRHEMDWVRACKESPENRSDPCASFDYSGPLSEMVLMGNLAIRLQQLNRKLKWDGGNMKITNIGAEDKLRYRSQAGSSAGSRRGWQEVSALDSANEWINHTYREGWAF
ncbi:MAG: Gfo/Idh/MocA family oxidoreductase [Bacteroidales bacterium]|nr:MAG: Gfo/Idh/MocA family oxidoreductase [Bacteroidales bacterium]